MQKKTSEKNEKNLKRKLLGTIKKEPNPPRQKEIKKAN